MIAVSHSDMLEAGQPITYFLTNPNVVDLHAFIGEACYLVLLN